MAVLPSGVELPVDQYFIKPLASAASSVVQAFEVVWPEILKDGDYVTSNFWE